MVQKFTIIHIKKIKYGVMHKDNLIKDLRDWDYLYIAGRLHKEVNIIENNEEIEREIINNYISAIRVSLLLLPATFSEIDLYKTIASLSYIGDVRMIVGENKNKVDNIVSGNVAGFQRIYKPLISEHFSNFVNYDSTTNIYTKSTDIASRFEILKKSTKYIITNYT